MKRHNLTKIMRQSIIDRDDGLCIICGRPAVDLHHIMFKSRSGNNTAYNLVCVCRRCHSMIHGNNKKWFPILLKHQRKHYPNLTIEKMKRGKI